MGVTLIWRTDLHLSDKPPKSRSADWSELLLDKVRQVGVLAHEVGAAAVLDGGDFFHVKSPSNNTHSLVHRAMEAHVGYPCDVYGNIGNHDCKYGDYKYLNEQPLGVMFESGMFVRLYDEHEEVFGVGDVTAGCTVRIVGVPYHGVDYDMERLKSIKKGDEDYLVVVAHLLAAPGNRTTMFEGEDIVSYNLLKDLDPDVWCFGHWHKNQGVREIVPGKYVVNIGSMSRGALSQDEAKRTPVVAVLRFDADGIEIEEVPLQVRPAEEVFDIDGRVRTEARNMNMEMFVDSIEATLADTEGVPIPDIIRGLTDVLHTVKERALLYWEEAVGNE